MFKLLAGILVFLFGLVMYLFSGEKNPVTGEKQRVAYSTEEEVEIGREARGDIARQLGGVVSDRTPIAQQVDRTGEKLVGTLESWLSENDLQNPYAFEFHVTADRKTVNALALPGGQIFITLGLLDRLETESQLAAVLAHEIGHVIHRHASERMAKANFRTTTNVAWETATGNEGSGGVAAWLSQLMDLRYGRGQELESDAYAIGLLQDAGYRPDAMIELLDILEEASGGGPPEFLSTHPHPENRREQIREMLAVGETA